MWSVTGRLSGLGINAMAIALWTNILLDFIPPSGLSTFNKATKYPSLSGFWCIIYPVLSFLMRPKVEIEYFGADWIFFQISFI